jgi:hypothetical protein
MSVFTISTTRLNIPPTLAHLLQIASDMPVLWLETRDLKHTKSL